MISKKELSDKIYSGERISDDEALSLFGWDIVELGMAADFRLKRVFPENRVGFVIDRIINFTNACEAACLFCAYHARAGLIERYDLTIGEILDKVAELVSIGGTQVMLQGGINPDYKLIDYIEMAEAVKRKFPEVYLHSYSPAEVVHLAKRENLTVKEVLSQLKGAGVSSIPGASDLLVDRVRSEVSPRKMTKDEWVSVMDALAELGMTSTATMTYGMGETLEERVSHLKVIRDVQDRTGIIKCFIPWSFSPRNTKLSHIIPATGVDYLKILSIGRIYLDNVTNIQTGWLTEGMKLGQLALAMGANDMGGILMEEKVVRVTGVETVTNRDQVVELIKNAGKIPFQRDSQYNEIRRFA